MDDPAAILGAVMAEMSGRALSLGMDMPTSMRMAALIYHRCKPLKASMTYSPDWQIVLRRDGGPQSLWPRRGLTLLCEQTPLARSGAKGPHHGLYPGFPYTL